MSIHTDSKPTVAAQSRCRPVFAHGIATANPPHAVSQNEMRDLMAETAHIDSKRLKRLLGVFQNAGVKRRYTTLPLEELRAPRGWPARNAAFLECAETLLEATNRKALADSGLEPGDIDIIVSVTTTGTAVPDMSARQSAVLGLRPDVKRFPIYGYGCAGGPIGLARAAEVARAYPGRHVLLQIVELCLTQLDPTTESATHLVASALFGDGAASVVVSTEGPGLFTIGSSREHILPDTREVMGWGPGETSLDFVLGLAVPGIIRTQLGAVAESFVSQTGIALDSFGAVFAHPGSLKVIGAVEDALGLSAGSLVDTREILEEYGNMSAVTVLFILQNAMRKRTSGSFLMAAIGPGITTVLLEGEIAGVA
jgi:alkylresorcinol/alkylpyrone synthase